MSLIKSFFIGIMLFIPFLKSYASGLKDTVSVGFNTYGDTNDVQVYSPTFSIMKTLSKHFLVGFKMRVDAISSASIRNASGDKSLVDTVAGASDKSGFDDIRFAPTFIVSYDDGTNSVSGGGYYSKEVDYTGKAIFLNYVRQLNQDNTAVGIGFSQSNDKWSPTFKRNLPKDYRNEQKIDLSVNQLLSPTASIQFVYSYMNSTGFLSSPYHYVKQTDLARFENYKDTRMGQAFAIKGVNLLTPSTSIKYSYRYYKDDWDISSHTISTEVLHDINKKIMIGARVRYYTQTKASFTKDIGTYKQSDTYFVTDYRMSAFDSYSFGVPITYKPSVDSPYKFSFSMDYYQTSDNDYIKQWQKTDNLKAIYTSFSFEYEF